MIIKSPTHEYDVGDLVVAQTAHYRSRLCTQIGTGRQCLLQIANDAAGNGVLDRMAFILRELRVKSDELEVEFEPHRRRPESRLNYHYGFPEVVDSFIFHEQGGRRINILAFPCLEAATPPLEVGQLVPLSNIVTRDHKRIDLKTSPWILGKSLKILAFAHDNGYELGGLDLTKILIQPDKHFVIFFDWSDARFHPEGVPAEIQRNEIMELARCVVTLLGGDAATRSFPDEGIPEAGPYYQFLLELAAGGQTSALGAHKTLYPLLREQLGWNGFHKFATFQR